MKDKSRCRLLSDALRVCRWLSEQARPFTAQEFASALEFKPRTGYRWLQVAEGCGLVENLYQPGELARKGRKGFVPRETPSWRAA